MKERYFAYDVYQEMYYCKKCNRNHRFNNNIGKRHRKFGVHPFGLSNTVIKYKKKVVN